MRAPRARSAALAAAAGLIALAAGEMLLRLALFRRRPDPQRVAWVANFYGDDTFHRLFLHMRLRGHEDDPVYRKFDPMLGWTARPRSADNPLGIATAKPYQLRDLREHRRLLFFGDSFVAGVGLPSDAIPGQLGTMLPDLPVLNLGVPAYGLDQMYLLFRDVIDQFDRPHVVVGLLFNDIDRVAYRVHVSIKPYFEIEDGRLVEHGVPIPANYRAWLEALPLPPRLYVLSALGGLLRRIASTRWATEYLFFLHPSQTHELRAKKVALTERLLRALRNSCTRRKLRLTVILFPHPEHVVGDGWYAPFLHRVLSELGIDYLDLTDALRRRVREQRLDWRRDVYPMFRHPSVEENRFFAREIASFLESTYGYRTR
jgi:hypothetical protein